MEAATPMEFFEKILPQRFDAKKAADVDVTVQVRINGANGGDWIVTIKNQKLNVKQGIHPSANLWLRMNEKDYLDLVNHRISAEKAFFTGKVQFKGNIALALKLRDAGFL